MDDSIHPTTQRLTAGLVLWQRQTRTTGLILVQGAVLLGALWVAFNASDLSAAEVSVLALLPAVAVGALLATPSYACRGHLRDRAMAALASSIPFRNARRQAGPSRDIFGCAVAVSRGLDPAKARRHYQQPMGRRIRTRRRPPSGRLLTSRGRQLIEIGRDLGMEETTELAASLLLAAGHEETLIRALEDRLTVGQALGVLMGRHHVNADHAMHMLANEAARRGVRLREAALSTIDACMTESLDAAQ